jgi:hypothetical protein
MLRYLVGLLIVLSACYGVPAAGQAPDPPLARYEISINGEHFTVDGDRVTKLKSSENPKTTYEVAVRLAQLQRWKLNNAQFDYDKGFSVSDDLKSPLRTATLKHGLGFVMTVSDLGAVMTAEAQDRNLTQLADRLVNSYHAAKATAVDVTEPQRKKLGSSDVSGVTIRYDDADGVGHITLCYFVTGEAFTCSSTVQCLEADRDDVMPLVRPTLESFRPRLAKTGASQPKPAKKK